MKKYKDRLIEIYRRQLEKAFWAYENPVEFQFLKYLTSAVDLYIKKIAGFWSKPSSYLSTEYKLKLLLAKECSVKIISEIKKYTSKLYDKEFAERLCNFAEVLNAECREKNIVNKGAELSKLDEELKTDHQVLALTTEYLKRQFEDVLKDMGFKVEIHAIYSNVKEYIDMYENEILGLSEVKV